MEYQLNSVEEQIDFGLRCPNGTVLWSPETYKEYAFDTVEARNGFADILAGAAAELKIDPQVFVSAFSWVPRHSTTYTVSRVDDGGLQMGTQWPTDDPVDGAEPAPNE